MSVDFNIITTDEITYKTDSLSPEGLTKYHIRNSNYVEKISNSEYGLGYSGTECNPIVANKTILFGDNLYNTEILFDTPVIAFTMAIAYPIHLYINRMYVYYGTDEMIWMLEGREYYRDTYRDFTLYHGDEVDYPPDMDRTAGLFLQLYNETDFPTTVGTGVGTSVYNSILSYSQFRDLWALEYRIPNRELFNYLSSYCHNNNTGLFFAGDGSNSVAFRYYYKTTSGIIKQVPFYYINHYFPTYGFLANIGQGWIFPFTDNNEYNAAKAASYKWDDATIQQIDQYIN